MAIGMQLDALLHDFAEELRSSYGEQIKTIILYGSAARGELREDSDIDIAVIIDSDPSQIWRQVTDIAVEFMLRSGRYLAIQVLHTSDLARDYNPYIRALLTEGVTIA